MAFQVLLVDDHKIMRDGIKAILRHSDEFAVFGEAESGTEAVQVCRKKKPDIILMDIGLPGLNGIETTTEILRHCPDVKIIILSMYDDEHSVVSAIRSGARAFVLKKASNNRSWIDSGMPGPLSSTRSTARSFTRLVLTFTMPCIGAASIAFVSRFDTTCFTSPGNP